MKKEPIKAKCGREGITNMHMKTERRDFGFVPEREKKREGP